MFMLRFHRGTAGNGVFPWFSTTLLIIYVLFQIFKLYLGTKVINILHNYFVEKVPLDELLSELKVFNAEQQKNSDNADNSEDGNNSGGNTCPVSDNPYESPREPQANLPLNTNNFEEDLYGSVLFQRVQNYANANGYFFICTYRDPAGYIAKWINAELSTALYFYFYRPDGESFGFETASVDQREFCTCTNKSITGLPLPSFYWCQVFPEITDPDELWEIHRAGMEYLEAEHAFSFTPNQTWQFDRFMSGGTQAVLKAFQDRDADKIWEADLSSLPETQKKLEKHLRNIPFWRMRVLGWSNERPKKYNGHFISELVAKDLIRVKFNWNGLFVSLIYLAFLLFNVCMYFFRTYN